VIEPTYDRPVQFSGVEYIRIGENVKLLKDFPEHAKSLWLATSRRRFESAIALPHQSARSVLALLEADVYYRLSEEEKPTRNAEVLRRFINRGFILDDMEGGYDITNLGALLFARDLTPFPSVATKSVRVIKYLGKDKRRAESETEGKRGYAVGFQGILSFVKNMLPREERFEGGIRHTVSLYSEIALREIIANSLIHQDFTISGAGPVIEVYDDRIEVINPGNSLIERDRIIDERRSRNEKLAAAMRELNICEERGGGIDKAIIDIEEMFLPAPEFHASTNSMRVIVFGPKNFGELSKTERIWACFCHCVVRWARHDYMGNASLRERFGLPNEQYQIASNVIADARSAGRIVPADPDQGNRNARYVPYWARENVNEC
jgi:ATP-dependent DNA helicase RecG